MHSESGSDNSDHIPITFVDSGTPVVVLATDPDVHRTSAVPPERSAAEHSGRIQIEMEPSKTIGDTSNPRFEYAQSVQLTGIR